MPIFKNIIIPSDGGKIIFRNNSISVPDYPVIPFIEGDGIGPDIWRAARSVLDAAVEKSHGSRRKILWMEIFAGEKAVKMYGEKQYLPEETIDAIREFSVAIKGPLTTPVGKGVRSINVTLRQKLNLYALIRPTKYFKGIPSPVKRPQNLDVVVVRENTEDEFTGVEFSPGSAECVSVIDFLNSKSGIPLGFDSGISIKSISRIATERLMKKAVEYAVENGRRSVTIVHKGNIMKFTEGAFKQWSYETALKYFREIIITEEEMIASGIDEIPAGKILIKNRIADTVFQQVLLRPEDYDVFATPNLIGDYLSDACAAQVGGLGVSPGVNIGDNCAVFEAAHGSAPKYAGQDKANPAALILSGAMMLKYLGWNKPAVLVEKALKNTFRKKIFTYDFARFSAGNEPVSCSGFSGAVIKNMLA